MSDYPGCVGSVNVVCKHARALKTFYVNLNFLPAGVTVVSATADTADVSLAVDAVTILDTDTTIDTNGQCLGDELEADRALLINLSGGVASDEEVIVTVTWVQSDAVTDSRDCRLLVSGTAP